MKTIKQTRIGKFLSDHNLGYLLSGVADMPPSVPLLTWLKDAVQDEGTLKPKHKQSFTDLFRMELESLDEKKTDLSREAAKRKAHEKRRRRGFVLGMLSTMI